MTIRDITARKVAEEALKQSFKALEKPVEERTADLVAMNDQLAREVGERKHIEKSLTFLLRYGLNPWHHYWKSSKGWLN